MWKAISSIGTNTRIGWTNRSVARGVSLTVPVRRRLLRYGMVEQTRNSTVGTDGSTSTADRSKVTVTKTSGTKPPSLAAASAGTTSHTMATRIEVPGAKKEFEMTNMEKEMELMSIQQDIHGHYQNGNYKDALQTSLDFLQNVGSLW